MEKADFSLGFTIKIALAATTICFICFAVVSSPGFCSEKVLFESNFSDLQTKWETIDDPTAEDTSQWRVGLAELSGLYGDESKVAAILLTGDKSWRNYAVETSLFAASPAGYLSGIVFGYQDPQHFYVAGYNFAEDRFELECRTPEGFEMLSFREMRFPDEQDIPLRLDFAGGRIRLYANNRVIFDIEDSRYQTGKIGLGTSRVGAPKIMFGPVTVKSIDPSTLPPETLHDLLSARAGAAVVSEQFKERFSYLIDHRSTPLEIDCEHELHLSKPDFPVEGTYSFPDEAEAEIHKIGVQLSDRYFPEAVEVLASNQNIEESFKSVGTFKLKPEKDSYQEFNISPVTAKYIKLRILSATDSRRVYISEMFAYGYFKQKSSATRLTMRETEPVPTGELLLQEDFTKGGLTQWDIWSDPEASYGPAVWKIVLSEYSDISNDLHKPATIILAGEKDWNNYRI